MDAYNAYNLQQGEYVSSVASQAIKTAIVDVAGCNIMPQTVKAKLGSEITFTNTGSTTHILRFTNEKTYVAEAGKDVVVKFDFWNLPGVRKYRCDDVRDAGIIYLEE